MARFSLSEARTQIVEILDESIHQALGLKESLQDERHALEQQDTDALKVALTTKGVCVNHLQVVENRRIELCDASGFAAGPEQMGKFLEWCDEGSAIAERWLELLDIAAECNTLNLTNGAIVQAHQQMVATNLSVIRGGDAVPDTYQREGRDAANADSQSLARA